MYFYEIIIFMKYMYIIYNNIKFYFIFNFHIYACNWYMPILHLLLLHFDYIIDYIIDMQL